jgi:hypothetical protein
MSDEETKRKVLERRAEGKSFKEIERETGFDIQTLMTWTREMQEKVKRQGCGC